MPGANEAKRLGFAGMLFFLSLGAFGGCKSPTEPSVPKDECPNLAGIQTSIPEGYIKVSGECLKPVAARLEAVAWTEPAEVPKGEHEVILRADSGSRVRVIELSVFGKPEEGKVAEYKGGPSEDLPTSEVLFIELRDNARKPGDPPGTTGVLWYKEATVTGDDIRSLSLIFRATDGSLHTLSAKDAPLRSVLENDLRVWLDAKGMPSWI